MHNVVSRLTLSVAATAVVAGALVTAGPAAADPTTQRTPAVTPASGSYTPLTPTRILDTRPASGLAGSSARTVQIAGLGGLPTSGIAAVVLNLTVVTPQASGYLSAYPNPGRPTSSNLNFSAGRTIANLAVVPVAADGTVQLYNGSGGRTDVLADVTGWFAPAATTPGTDGAFKPVGPARLLDTRPAHPVPAGGSITLPVTGRAGVPALAGAAVLNITAVGAGAAGYLSVYPGTVRSGSSNLNFATGQTVAGLTATRLSSDDGSVTILNASSKPLQITVDVAGWFRGTTAAQAGMFSFLPPTRVFDTRGGLDTARAPLPAGTARTIAAAGHAGIPTSGVAAVVLNVTATNATASGYLTVYSGTKKPTSSTLNFGAGQTVPNLVVVPVTAGSVTVFNGSAHPVAVLADVAGFVRSSDLDVPSAGTSHYIRNAIDASQTDTQIGAAMASIGTTDGRAASASDPQVVLLQFGAQSAVAGPAGNQKGVRLTTDAVKRLTYDQVVAAVNGYVDGYAEGRGTATNPVTVLVGTNTDGFAGADTSYPPVTKGQDWANLVVEPAVAHAAATGITVTGASDIEPDFDANVAQITAWINAYLGAGPNPLVNNGAASGCPTTLGQISRTCSPVPIKNSSSGQTNTWKQTDHYNFAAGLNPSRIRLLPQIYTGELATQWEDIALTGTAVGKPAPTFAGVLTSVSACAGSGDCESLDPATAWTSMTQALEADSTTAGRTVPAVTDIAIS